MKTFLLGEMIKGWFIGDFSPVVFKTDKVEVAVKYYSAGDYEELHYHKIASECTVIAQGCVRMNGTTHSAGSIIFLDPGEATDFEALEDNTITVVVKMPSVASDKYEGNIQGYGS